MEVKARVLPESKSATQSSPLTTSSLAFEGAGTIRDPEEFQHFSTKLVDVVCLLGWSWQVLVLSVADSQQKRREEGAGDQSFS